MGTFTLHIYDENDEIIKTYEQSRVRFGLLEEAIKISEKNADKKPAQYIDEIKKTVKAIFPDMTDEHMKLADFFDVVNVFKQLQHKADALLGNGSKNA